MHPRLVHLWLALTVVPGLLFDRRRRALLGEIHRFIVALPARMAEPLPVALAGLDPAALPPPSIVDEATLRGLVDLASLLARQSPLGLCLRRSLARYHYLGRAGIPLDVHFGARLEGHVANRDLNGHAWLTRDGRLYHELGDQWRDFKVIFSWPEAPVT